MAYNHMEGWVGRFVSVPVMSTVRACCSWILFTSAIWRENSVFVFRMPPVSSCAFHLVRCKFIRWSLHEARPIRCLPEGVHIHRRNQGHAWVFTGLVYRIPHYKILFIRCHKGKFSLCTMELKRVFFVRKVDKKSRLPQGVLCTSLNTHQILL